jgi:cohesin loading factor subunit SCC2
MAENFASFEYKTLEEVLTVIKYLTNILSTTGMQILEIVSPSHLLTHLHARQDLVHLMFLFGTVVQAILERAA